MLFVRYIIIALVNSSKTDKQDVIDSSSIETCLSFLSPGCRIYEKVVKSLKSTKNVKRIIS